MASVIAGCAKNKAVEVNTANVKYWNAWIKAQQEENPEYLWQKTPLGAYILESEGGEGSPLGNESAVPYVLVNYTIRDVDGEVIKSNTESIAKQLGTYSESGYYAPALWARGAGSIPAGFDELLSMMKPGQRIKAVLPGWITEIISDSYATEEEYIKNVSGTSYILDMELVRGIIDLDFYQVSEIIKAARNLYGEMISETDSVAKGLFYIQLKEPTDTAHFASGDEVKVNYSGKFVTGQCFDTSIKDTAKVHHLYNSSNTYEPMEVNWGEDASSITVGDDSSGSLIPGFQKGLFRMRTGEKGVVMFVSDLGYGGTGSGTIPGFCPLIFELEVIGKQ